MFVPFLNIVAKEVFKFYFALAVQPNMSNPNLVPNVLKQQAANLVARQQKKIINLAGLIVLICFFVAFLSKSLYGTTHILLNITAELRLIFQQPKKK